MYRPDTVISQNSEYNANRVGGQVACTHIQGEKVNTGFGSGLQDEAGTMIRAD